METAKKGKSKKAAAITAEKIREAYVEYLLTKGKRPATVFKFCKDTGFSEDAFYAEFGSFAGIEKEIWKGFAQLTIGRLQADQHAEGFNAREKILAFYFTLAEVLRAERSLVLFQLKDWKVPGLPPVFIKSFKSIFDPWIEAVLDEGKKSGEIAKRPYLDKKYGSLLWLHLHFILRFWSQDDSAGFEKTDAAIEKSVNLAFDLIGKGIIDNALDFGKFLYQQARD